MARPSAQELEKIFESRRRVNIGPNNVLVIYDSSNGSGISAQDTAISYATARNIPTGNILGLDFSTLSGVADLWTKQSITRSQILPIAQEVKSFLNNCGKEIVCFVLVGDFPHCLTDTYAVHTGGTSYRVSFFDVFNHLDLFCDNYQFYNDEFLFRTYDTSGYWDGSSYGPVDKWYFSTSSTESYNPNMRYNPKQLTKEVSASEITGTGKVTHIKIKCRVTANIPLYPFYGNTNASVSDLWTKAIAAEQANKRDWGVCLLYQGGSNSAVSRVFLEEQKYEELPYSETYYQGFDTVNPETHTSGTASNNPLWQDTLSDYDPNGWAKLQPGETGFSSVTGPVFFRSPGYNSYYRASDGTTVEEYGDYVYEDGSICAFTRSYGAWPSTYIVGPFGVPVDQVAPPSLTSTVQSRASAAIASGATMAFGVAYEPGSGPMKYLGFMTHMWYGGNIAEWMMKMQGGTQAPNSSISVVPNGWVVYGDPLYAPFKWRIEDNKMLYNWDHGMTWDNAVIAWDFDPIPNPAKNQQQTKNNVENVLSNSNTRHWTDNYTSVAY